MENIKDYITTRIKFLQSLTNDDDNITIAAQIHELKVLQLWINQHEENEQCNN